MNEANVLVKSLITDFSVTTSKLKDYGAQEITNLRKKRVTRLDTT